MMLDTSLHCERGDAGDADRALAPADKGHGLAAADADAGPVVAIGLEGLSSEAQSFMRDAVSVATVAAVALASTSQSLSHLSSKIANEIS